MKTRAAVSVLALALSAACASAADSKAGEAVFLRACKTCHGAGGHGNPAIAKALNVAIPDLASKEIQGRSDEELQNAVAKGKGKMKPVATVTGQELPDLIAFLRTLGKQ